MSKAVELGAKNGDLQLSVDRLIETRLLITATSGAGKSWALRKLLEETHGTVQHIVFDMEGEFATLRAKFPYVVAGKGGDIAADPKTAALLARKILELETSLICDLYELKQPDRIFFVKNFLEAMINAPKELWHPVLVVVDEAHVFASQATSSLATGAVIDLCTRGRKRGYCAVLATQRLSKLHKDAAAETINKLVGRTNLDIDLKRAGDELGFSSRDDYAKLRGLEPGQFFALGPAFSAGVEGHGWVDTPVKIGNVKTQHPEIGKRIKGGPVPAPTAEVKAALAKLVDLPKEVEEDAQDREALRRRLRELEQQITKAGPTTEELRVAQQRGYEAGWRDASGIGREVLQGLEHQVTEGLQSLQTHMSSNFQSTRWKLAGDSSEKLQKMTKELRNSGYVVPNRGSILRGQEAPRVASVRPAATSSGRPPARRGEVPAAAAKLTRCEREILRVLVAWPSRAFSKVQLGSVTGYAYSSGNFSNAVSRLTVRGFVERAPGGSGALIVSRDAHKLAEARELVGELGPVFTLDHWLSKLGKCAREVFQVVKDDQDGFFSKEEIARMTGYVASSGNFSNALSKLSTLGLIERVDGGIRMNRQVRELGLA